MKKTLLSLAFAATALVALPGLSAAAETYNGGYFINAGVGRTDTSKSPFDTNDTGYQLNGGYRWGLFGVEIGYTDLGTYKQNVSAGGTPFSLQAKVHGPTLGGNVHVPVGDNFFLSGRAGVYHFDVSEQAVAFNNGSPVLAHESDNGYKPYAGVGVGYDFSSNISIGVNYDYYKAEKADFDLSSKMLSVNAEYRF